MKIKTAIKEALKAAKAIAKEDLQEAMQANKSTIFHGIRFYFHSYKALKKFCEIVEK